MYFGLVTLVFIVLSVLNVLAIFIPRLTRLYAGIFPDDTFLDNYFNGILELQEDGEDSDKILVNVVFFTILVELIILPLFTAVASLLFPLLFLMLFLYIIFKSKFKKKN